MFTIHMPVSFKVGDTADCRINKRPARLTWRDKNHLVIEPDDVRTIVMAQNEGDLISFICGDAGDTVSDYRVEGDLGKGVVFVHKPPQRP